MTRATIESVAVERPDPTADAPQGMCLDQDYDYDEVRELLTEFGFTAHIRAWGQEAKALKQEEIGKVVGLDKTSSVSSAYLRLKARVTKERRPTRRVRRSEEALLKSKKRP